MKPRSGGKPSEFVVDPKVRKLLGEWGQARGTEVGLMDLSRQAQRLTPEQREQLMDRLAEISLGLLFVIGERNRPE